MPLFTMVSKNVEDSRKISVIIADDHKMVRQGLREMVENQGDMTVAGEAADGKEALQLTREKKPDVVLMDFKMPEMNGDEATQKIVAEDAESTVIGLSLFQKKVIAQRMKKAGAIAFFEKTEDFGKLCKTIRNEVQQ